MKKISNIFILLAIILSDVMCAAVAYNYCGMEWGIKYAGYSAPAWVAFVYVIPFGVGIIACLIIAAVFRKKESIDSKI